jgi:exodeoxyribonuclease V alpha subunit
MCVRVPALGRFLQNGFDGSNSQGSEWPWVVVLCHSTHAYMLSRQLLYTAITRAKAGVVLVGDKKGLSMALKNVAPSRRNTSLVERLKGAA